MLAKFGKLFRLGIRSNLFLLPGDSLFEVFRCLLFLLGFQLLKAYFFTLESQLCFLAFGCSLLSLLVLALQLDHALCLALVKLLLYLELLLEFDTGGCLGFDARFL